MITGSLG